MESSGARPIVAGDVLLARFKGRALQLCVRLGIGAAALSALIGAFSTEDRVRRVAAPLIVLAAWLTADRRRYRWTLDVRADRRRVLAAAVISFVPFAVDAHAQSNVFLALGPLAGIAAVTCRRREVIIFASIWLGAYVAGAIAGGGSHVFEGGEHPFDAAEQILAILACSGLFAAAVLGFRRYIEHIPEHVARLREQQTTEVPPGGERADAQAEGRALPSDRMTEERGGGGQRQQRRGPRHVHDDAAPPSTQVGSDNRIGSGSGRRESSDEAGDTNSGPATVDAPVEGVTPSPRPRHGALSGARRK
jgi:hypothetical protein